jgi:hypothetical protein
MRIKLDLPELTEFQNGFPGYWMSVIFMGNRPDTYHTHAITATYVRSVEAAFFEYRQGRSLVYKTWVDRHPSTIPIGTQNLACSSFEQCLTSMHRCVRCMLRIRGGREVPQALKDLIPTRPRFVEDRIADRIRGVRDAIQHLEEVVLDGTIPENTPFMLGAVGPERPIPEEPRQTLKTIDRLQIGNFEITFLELCTWLKEMGQCAEQISKFERSPSG